VASNTGITLVRATRRNHHELKVFVGVGTPGVPSVRTAGEIKKGDIYSPGNAIGVRGREDLGGGTAAWFQLEAGAWPDGRLDSAASTGSHFGGRNSGIGVSSGLGDIMLGIWDTPYKQTMFMWNSLTSGGFSSGGIIMGNGDTTGALEQRSVHEHREQCYRHSRRGRQQRVRDRIDGQQYRVLAPGQ